MRNFIVLGTLIFLMAGCKPGIPKDIVQPDQMASVLHDIHLTDGYINTIANIDTAKVLAAAYYKGIYKKYGIDSALYARSMEYYYSDPKTLDEIYKKVGTQFEKEKRQIVRADSLKNVKIEQAARKKAKADSAKVADSLKNLPVARQKRRTDSIKRADSLEKVKSRRILKKKLSFKKAEKS
ncbi:DUF4296 domain-containing protein [Pedobacter faecalis]|uniref:DUF4296 domain-containing protein n=1 Tax=Pedobacter faecalis TaxID=3041495 RepID=UPI00254BF2BB|nr:DUF4296 domain-containing protein [Pedobacter sp. ELA7]